MSVPVSQMWAVASYVMKQVIRRRKRYPLVLMLEPLLRCNLACAGCGKIQYPGHILKREMPVEDALKAAREAGAPVVSIAGGEPLMHSQIEKLVAGLVAQRRYVYLCTNALLLKQRLEQGTFTPSKYLTFSVHMDGDEEAHDFAVCREGTYTQAEEALKLAIAKGFRVTTNSTLFQHADPTRMRAFFDRMMGLGVESMMLSPGYSYQKAPEQSQFLARQETHKLFKALFHDAKRGWRFNQSPLFLEFLMGKRHFECTPWGNPCYTIFGWQRPCYLLQEGYAKTLREVLDETPWENYGRASGNPKCQQCMVHCGYEPTAVHHTFASLRGFAATVKATLLPLDSRRGKDIEPPKVTRFVETGKDGAPEGSLERALHEACDYRGDVTLHLAGERSLTGYLYDVGPEAVSLFTEAAPEGVKVAKAEIERVSLTGTDFAAGKSFEAWAKRYHEKKARERAEREAGAPAAS